MWSLAWDETTRLLTLQLPGALRAAQRRSSWHVCVSTSKFDVVYTQASTWKMWRHTANLSRANVALMTTSAEALADALFDSPVAKMHTACGQQLVRDADIGIVHWCRDAAAANTRLIAAMQQEWSEAHGLAGVLSTVSKMYDVCSLCNMGANFFRFWTCSPLWSINSLSLRNVSNRG